MYKYHPNNKHYIVVINDRNYLIDTGRPRSFLLSDNDGEIVINSETYHMDSIPPDIRGNERQIQDTVGVKLDGFICNDIILKTSLTIYRDGFLDFKADAIEGRKCKFDMKNSFSMIIKDDNKRNLLIDTGAMVGYGIKGLFEGLNSFTRIKDFNPALSNLESNAYHVGISIQDRKGVTTVCDNAKVMYCLNSLMHLDVDMVINVTDMFDEVCVINGKTREIIFK